MGEVAMVGADGLLFQQSARWKRLRFEDHLSNVSRKNIPADVPTGINVGAEGPPDGVGHHFRDKRPDRPQFDIPRSQQPHEGLGKVLIFDDNRPLVLP
jgi:hypothetical protein